MSQWGPFCALLLLCQVLHIAFVMEECAARDIEVTRPVIVLFLHGSGGTGPTFRQWVDSIVPIKDFIPDHAAVLFPTAPLRPYTLMQGMNSNVWFDRRAPLV